MATAYIGLGSNQGDRLQLLSTALNKLEQTGKIKIAALSPVYETTPVGGPPQGPYLNSCAALQTGLYPAQLLDQLLEVETSLGRERTEVWGPRTIDLDLLVYQEVVMHTPLLELPHPRLTERGFVLVPLADIAPGLKIPGCSKTVSQLLSDSSFFAGVNLYKNDWFPIG